MLPSTLLICIAVQVGTEKKADLDAEAPTALPGELIISCVVLTFARLLGGGWRTILSGIKT